MARNKGFGVRVPRGTTFSTFQLRVIGDVPLAAGSTPGLVEIDTWARTVKIDGVCYDFDSLLELAGVVEQQEFRRREHTAAVSL